MKRLGSLAILFACALVALPAFAHPGHGAAPGHAWHEHAALQALACAAIAGVLSWIALRHRRGLLPLAIVSAVALGAGTAGAALPL
ncbi:MAG: hypothetical protein EOP92_27700 [Lysobacteraceae bacterium]|nr:MAG: hypothetical protein EOP92_27700 [Xanthomonadaceae bacterium]